jgi:MYXO-CTERM domain-containing protein
MKSCRLVLVAVAGVAAGASAQPVFFATANDTLYRFSLGGPIDEFQLSDRIMSLAVNPDGDIVGYGPDINGNQARNSFRLDNPFGSPSLSLLSDQITSQRPTLTFVGDEGYTVGDIDVLRTVDSVLLEDTGVVGNLGLPTDSNGSGYDAVNDVFYLINGTNDALYTVNYSNAATTLVGSLGLDYHFGGAEFFEGTLYALIEDTSRQELVLGSIDTSSGAFTPLQSIASYDPNQNNYIGLAVVPTPSSLALLSLGALAAGRRRR